MPMRDGPASILQSASKWEAPPPAIPLPSFFFSHLESCATILLSAQNAWFLQLRQKIFLPLEIETFLFRTRGIHSACWKAQLGRKERLWKYQVVYYSYYVLGCGTQLMATPSSSRSPFSGRLLKSYALRLWGKASHSDKNRLVRLRLIWNIERMHFECIDHPPSARILIIGIY